MSNVLHFAQGILQIADQFGIHKHGRKINIEIAQCLLKHSLLIFYIRFITRKWNHSQHNNSLEVRMISQICILS